MATLTGKLVADTYKALLKMIDNDVVTATEKQISDGLGGGTGIFIDQDGEIRASKYRVTAGTSSQFLKADGSLDSTSYLPSGTTTTSIPEGSNLYFTNSRVLNTTLNGFTAISGTVTSVDSVLTAIEKIWWNIVNGGGGGGGGYVPYVGATQNLNLGEYGLLGGFVQFDTTPTTAPNAVGALSWNDQDGTLNLKLKGGNVTLQIGQEQVTRVVNKTGVNLLESNYQAVRISGAQGNRLKVALAQANNDANSAETLGLVTENINDNNEGFITSSGLVRDINTTGSLQGETWADGDILYLSGTTAGRVTNIKPQAPIHTVIIGFVVRAHATQGAIFVKVDNGYELDELHNVKITAPEDKDFLVYDGKNFYWENRSIYGTEGYLPIYNDTNIFNDSIIYSDGVGIGVGTNILEPTAIATFFGNVDLVTGTYLTSDGFNLIGRGNLINQIEIGSQNASDYLTFIAGNAERARITAAGNFGIGLTNPSAPLHIKGSTYTNVIVDNNSATGGGSYLSYQNGTKKALFGLSGAFELNTGSDVAIASTIAGGGIKFYTNNSTTQAMGILSSGNAYLGQAPTFLGLGTEFIVRGQASDGVLGVMDSIEAVKGLFVSNSSLSWLGTYSNHPLAFRTNNTEWARISSAGNLLIGTIVDNTTDKLQVNGTSYFADNIVLADSKGIVSSGVNMLSRNNLNNQIIIGADGGINDNVAFYAGDLERMRLLANGRLAINKTTASYQVDVQGDVNVSGAFRVNGTIIPNGTVTSVAMSVPTGLVISGSPITSSGTLAVTYAVNYGIPTLTKQSDWDDAYTWVTNFPDQSSNAGKLLTTNGSVLSWASLVTGVSSVFGRTGAVTAQSGDYTTAQVTESGNLYYTDARSRLALSASAPLSYNNGTGAFSISQASGSTNGFLSSTDWNTFNNKQNALGYTPVPTTRTLTINGTSYDLSADRSWTIAAGLSGSGTTNYIPKFTASTTIGNSIIQEMAYGLNIGFSNSGASNVYEFQNFSNTASSNTRLKIATGGTSAGNAILQFTDNTNNWYINPDSSASYALKIGTSISDNKFVINTSGNVGIGTGSPTSKLAILGDGIRYMPVGETYGNSVLVIKDDGSNGTLDFASEIIGDANLASAPFTWRMSTVSQGRYEVMRLTNTGNLGLGVTPSAWASGFTALQVRNATFWSTGNDASITANAYYDGSNYRYIASSASSRVYHNTDGSISWHQAGSGTAGNAISFTQAMTLDASGNLSLGNTNGGYRINATGQGKFSDNTQGLIIGAYTNGGGYGAIYASTLTPGASNYSLALSSTTTYVNAPNNGNLLLASGGNEYFRLNGTSGNVSIGNTNNTYKLDVSGTGRFTGALNIANDVWHTTADGTQRLFFSANSNTYLKGTGVIIRDNNDLNMLTFVTGGQATFSSSVTVGDTLTINTPWTSTAIALRGRSGDNYSAIRFQSNNGATTYSTIYTNASDLNFENGGSLRMLITSGGNVGIGTTSPSAPLTLYKASSPDFDIVNSSALHRITGDTGDLLIRADYGNSVANSTIQFSIDGTERMRITSGGLVGIGTSSPSVSILHLNYNSVNNRALRLQDQNGIFDIITSGASQNHSFGLYDDTNGAYRLFVLNNGNVGIGTTSPSLKLEVVASNPSSGILAKILNSATSSWTGAQIQFTQDSLADWVIGQPAGVNAFAFWVNRYPGNAGSEVMRITSSGNVGIGTTSPGQKLSIDSGTSTASYLQFTAGSTTGTASTDGFHIGIDSAGKAIINQRENLSFGISTANTERVLINNSGIITITGNMRFYYANSPAYVIQLPNDLNDGQAIAYAWVAYSDARVKKNVSELNYGIDSIMKLKPVSYNHHSARNNQGKIDILEKYKYEIGFIAQEVYNVIPEVVNPGNDLELWGMNYERLTSVIVKGMQEQQVMIETNAEKIARLEKRVLQLESKNA